MASTQPTPTACVENRDFYRAWLLWTCLGVWHGVVCFGVPLRAFAGSAAVGMAGWHASLEELGSAVMTAVVITVTLRVCSWWQMLPLLQLLIVMAPSAP